MIVVRPAAPAYRGWSLGAWTVVRPPAETVNPPKARPSGPRSAANTASPAESDGCAVGAVSCGDSEFSRGGGVIGSPMSSGPEACPLAGAVVNANATETASAIKRI